MRVINERIVHSFGLAEMARLVTHNRQGETGISRPGKQVTAWRESARKAAPGETGEETPASPPEPWRPWVPECEALELSPVQRLFLGIGLMLLRAPVVVRSRGFARQVIKWDETAVSNTGSDETIPSPRVREGEIAREAQRQSFSKPGSKIRTKGNQEQSKKIAFSRSGSESTDLTTVEHLKSGPRPEIGKTRSTLREPTADASKIHDAIMPAETANGRSALERVSLQQEAPRIAENDQLSDIDCLSIETEFGGALYLINFGLFLNLYGDFTTPLDPGIELSVWDFIALVSREIAGKNVESDPLWSVLSQLAGRHSQEPPGADFTPPESWRIRAEWLEPFGRGGRWTWSSDGGRLRVRHDEGFLVLDVPLDGDSPFDQVTRGLQAYSAWAFNLGRASRRKRSAAASPLETWIDWLMPYTRARLRRALGLDDSRDIPDLLIRRRAQASVTDTHVDVFFSLADLPVEVRLSGLDRNPGWVPAAGRYVTFHYD